MLKMYNLQSEFETFYLGIFHKTYKIFECLKIHVCLKINEMKDDAADDS